MILPLYDLIDLQEDVYAHTCAIIKRAQQVTVAGDEELDENNGKVVSTAMNQILTKKVEFELIED